MSVRAKNHRSGGRATMPTGIVATLPPSPGPTDPPGHRPITPTRLERFEHVLPLVGEADANTEWGSEGKGHAVFLHTRSYKTSCAPSTIFLIGRRGTGKTAVLRMLQYETRDRRHCQDYQSSWLVDQIESYRQLAMNLRDSPFASLPDAELEHVAMGMWSWLLSVAAMCGAVWQVIRHDGDPHPSEAVETILRYLTQERLFSVSEGLTVQRDPLAVLSDAMYAAQQDLKREVASGGGSGGTGVARLMTLLQRRLKDARYEEALAALRRLTRGKGKATLVLVDSVDEYNLTDEITRAVTLGLMRAALDFYNRRHADGIIVKAAFPSELRPHLRVWSPEKVNDATHVICWSHSDLVTLVAKRYAYFVARERSTSPGQQPPQADLVDQFLTTHLPRTIRSRSGVVFDTLAYVFRHTQRKPRQVIALFNAILTTAAVNGFSPGAVLPAEVIISAVHQHTPKVAEGVYQVYELIYPEASTIVLRTLAGSPAIFTMAELDRMMKHAADIRHRYNLSKEEVQHLLVEAGMIGRVERESEVVLPEGRRVQVAQVLFQYQRAGSLHLASDDRLAIHPMFYEELTTRVEPNQFIYPIATDGEPTMVDG